MTILTDPSYWFGVAIGAGLMYKWHVMPLLPKVTLVVIPWTPEPEPEVTRCREHRRLVAGIVNNLRMAASLEGGTVRFERQGCAGLANILYQLARVADKAVDKGILLPPDKDLTTS